MRAASRLVEVFGSVILLLALSLASPGVEVSRAEANFSYDPALEPALGKLAVAPAVTEHGKSCAARRAGPGALPLQQIPLVAVTEGEALNSLNGRGYNIGKAEPDADLQHLLFEVRRHEH